MMNVKEFRKLLRGLNINEQLNIGSESIIKGDKSYSLKVYNDESDSMIYKYKFVPGYKEKEIIAIALMENIITL